MGPSLFIVSAASALLADQLSKVAVLSTATPTALRLRPRVAARPFAVRMGVRPAVLTPLWGVLFAAGVLASSTGRFALAAQAGVGLALGGAAGNLLDLRRRGGVVDFIDLKVWPAFNLADVAIVLGVVLAVAGR
jgi:lipoprotein signal peptidase